MRKRGRGKAKGIAAGPAAGEAGDLARVLAEVGSLPFPSCALGGEGEINPTLRLLARPRADDPAGEGHILVWREPQEGAIRTRGATREDLLALKLVAEGIPPEEAAAMGAVPVGQIDDVLWQAVDEGLLLWPRSLIRRPEGFPRGKITDTRFFTSSSFTLQWHVTQACDLSCAHCYDRAPRAHLPLSEGIAVLDDLRRFCRERFVRGYVSLSGGNPLLHPDFLGLYRAAADRGFGLSVLGNPAPRAQIEDVVAVRRPDHFQVSLEGLAEHNDRVRGPGHFARTLEFLGTLRELGVPSMVMLTLTADNIEQVIPLAQRLEGLVDDMHFNRLAMVGRGAALRLPSRERYARFLSEYLAAAQRLPALGLKDNLLSLLRFQRGEPPFGGCTGFGCGAAFNFLALLSDGEAHACRKFPSPVGNVLRGGLAAVYDGEEARRYRAGCAACHDCAVRPVCGGCLAVAHGFGLDPLRERDPLCFAGELKHFPYQIRRRAVDKP